MKSFSNVGLISAIVLCNYLLVIFYFLPTVAWKSLEKISLDRVFTIKVTFKNDYYELSIQITFIINLEIFKILSFLLPTTLSSAYLVVSHRWGTDCCTVGNFVSIIGKMYLKIFWHHYFEKKSLELAFR